MIALTMPPFYNSCKCYIELIMNNLCASIIQSLKSVLCGMNQVQSESVCRILNTQMPKCSLSV